MAFETLRQRLCEAPILVLPEGMDGFLVYYDAFISGLGAILKQRGHVTAYTSRQLKPHGVWCTIYTDQKSLKYLMDQQYLNMRQLKWLDMRHDYDCELLYHPGKANVVVDALSRKVVSVPMIEFGFLLLVG